MLHKARGMGLWGDRNHNSKSPELSRPQLIKGQLGRKNRAASPIPCIAGSVCLNPKHMKKLINLAKALDFSTETEYFDYCIDSYANGNYSQCQELFKDMSKADRKRLIQYIRDSFGYVHKAETYYFNLL